MKYRPVLTAAQISHLISLCKLNLSHPESIGCIATLSPFMAKIENGGIKAAYEVKPKNSILEAIGEEPKPSLKLEDEEIQKLWLTGNFVSLSLEEIKALQDWMYRNDKCTPEQEAAFESKGIFDF